MMIQSRSDNEVQDLTSSSPNMPGMSLSVHMHMLSIHSAAWQCAIHYAASLCRERRSLLKKEVVFLVYLRRAKKILISDA